MPLNTCIRSATAVFTVEFLRAWYDEVYFNEQLNGLNMNGAFDTEIYFARLKELDEETHIFNLLGFEMDISVLDEE